MEFGMKRVVASVQTVAILNRMYCGKAVSVASISKETKLSVSYTEQIFQGFAAATLLPANAVLVVDTISKNEPQRC